jgi:hypothetical protein
LNQREAHERGAGKIESLLNISTAQFFEPLLLTGG